MTVRQTNVIWLAFIMASSMLDAIREEQWRRLDKDNDGRSSEPAGLDPLLGELASIGKTFLTYATIRCPLMQAGQVAHVLKDHVQVALSIQARLLRIFAMYMPSFVGFGVFLRWNGGIVLGQSSSSSSIRGLSRLMRKQGIRRITSQ